MTAPADTPISHVVHLLATQPIHGCTTPGCGTQNTVTLHPAHGRRCPDHTGHPSGRYRPGFAADLVDAGRPDVAFRYLRTWLARQCDIRYAGARVRLALREELPVIVTNLTAFTAAAKQTTAAMNRLAEQLAVR